MIGRLTRRQLLALTAAGTTAMTFGSRLAFAQTGKTLRTRAYSDIQILDPAYRLAQPEGDVMEAIYTRLISFKPGDSWGWELDGAEKIEQTSPTTVDFTLKPGIMFTNGFGEMTAEDVKFSYERIADPKTESPYKDDWANLDHVEVKDKYSGTIVLKKPFAPLWSSTLPSGSGAIMSKAAVTKAGGRFEASPPATSGPYTIKEWQPKQRLVLVPSPDWKGEKPAFDEIVIMPIDDEKAAELGFQAGEIDFTSTSVSAIPNYLKSPPANAKFVRKPSLAYVWMGMNQDNPALSDQKVRRAIQHAIDVPAVLEAAYFGAAEPSTGIVAPGLIGHREKNLYSYDPEKAKELLKEAGKEGGMELTLSVLNKQEFVNAAQAVQAQLPEVGITVTIQQYDSGTFWVLGDEKTGTTWKDIQLIIGRFSMQPDPSFATAWFTPEQIGVWNWERFNSPEFGELHVAALSETDDAKRDVMYKKMQDLMEESGDYVFLTHEAVGTLASDKINAAIRPDGIALLSKFTAN
ncbi:peptide/nickel transport system substrate-binding protein [Rhodoligotrophos appendicifer]|uniref:ABC transporter substrate-binding protein n=1 Tax=Rhodoligotrophos appendicifer TaxID=987056 RepID=UPI001186A6E2|nr:ABC transporter substrate-binding protein [Rhodoligotrophos appendicifer]